MKTSEVKKVLNAGELFFDTISQRNGVITIRRGFYYRLGYSAALMVEKVKQILPQANILAKGEVYKPFRGGSSVRNSSHWYVTFTVD